MTFGKTRAATAAKLKANKNNKPKELQPKRLDFSTPNSKKSPATNPTPSTSSAAVQNKKSSKKSTSKATAATATTTTPKTPANPPPVIEEDVEMASARVPFPPFKTDDIEAWFRRVEHWFTFGKVGTEADKFALIASQIENPTVANLTEMLNPHAETPYTELKKKIISIFEKSTSSKMNELLSGCQLGDMKPSQLLAEMKRMGGNVGDEILRNLWAKRLPLHVQSVVAAATKSSLDEVTLIADAVIDVVGAPASSLNQVTNNNNQPPVSSEKNSEIDELRTAINQLTKSFRDLQSHRSRSNSRDNQSNRDRSSSAYRPPENRICRYHRKFGNNAYMCTKPCSFTPENDSKN